MEIELVKVRCEEKEILKNILEFYSYDFSYFYNYDLNVNGKYEIIDVDPYFKDDKNEAFFIKANGENAGFIFIKDEGSYKSVEEYWLMPKYRKGFLAYKILKELSRNIKGKIEFVILNKNKKWLESLEFMLNKNYEICKIIEKKQVVYEFEWGKYSFTKFLVECNI